jgi:hypothetical protein
MFTYFSQFTTHRFIGIPFETVYQRSLIKNLSQRTCRLLLVQVPRFACSLGSIMSAAVCMNTEVGMDMP